MACKPAEEQWATIFVHGSYGVALSAPSFLSVWNDKTEGTIYWKVQQAFRHARHFNGTSFIFDYGLHNVDFSEQGFVKAREPISHSVLALYRKMQKKWLPGNHEHYYTFGWSGLLSQSDRRKEAIKLYCQLIKSLSCCKNEAAKKTKIRFITHSHGGNVVLNLAAVDCIMKQRKPLAYFPQDSLKKMGMLIENQLRSGEINQQEYKLLSQSELSVDEVIMYGAPIQDETEGFCFSPFFKKVVNVYSKNDVVQGADFISTKTHKSRQRINFDRYKNCLSEHKNKVLEVCMTVDNNKFNRAKKVHQNSGLLQKKLNVMSALRGGKIISDRPYDPAHADFWWVTKNHNKAFYAPLPLVIFTPLLLHQLDDVKTGNHFTLNFSYDDTHKAMMNLVDSCDQPVADACVVSRSQMAVMKNQLRRVCKAAKKYPFTLSFGTQDNK